MNPYLPKRSRYDVGAVALVTDIAYDLMKLTATWNALQRQCNLLSKGLDIVVERR